MRSFKILLVLTVWLFCGPGRSHAEVTLFEESFDGPGLPSTLTYFASPNRQQWLIDGLGRLYADRFQHGGGSMGVISNSGFALTADGLRFTADIGRPSISVNPPTGAAPGGSNVGLIFGNYLVILHPGHPGGAVRLETCWSPTNMLPFTLVSSLNMGFTPALDALHHIEALVTPQGNGLDIDIEIQGLGTDSQMHTFNFSFFDPSPSLANANIGVEVSRLNIDDAFFDNLRVEGPDGAAFSAPFSDSDGDGRPDSCDACPGSDDADDGDGDGIPDGCDDDPCTGDFDSDEDGVLDLCDDCPDSDPNPEIVIDDCETGVENQLLDDGCTMADLITQCAEDVVNHGAFVRCVSRLTNLWKCRKIINGGEKGAIMSCAAQSSVP